MNHPATIEPSQSTMKSICFLPPHASAWQEMLDIARLLRARGDFQLVFLDIRPVDKRLEEQTKALGARIVVLRDHGDTKPSLAERLYHKLISWQPWAGPKLALLKGAHAKIFAHRHTLLRKALTQAAAGLLILYDGRNIWATIAMKAAQDEGVPIIYPPIAYAGDEDDLIVRRRREPEIYSLSVNSKICAKLKDHCLWDEKTKAHYTLYGMAPSLALQEMDMLPPRPFVPGCGRPGRFLLDSETARQRYLRLGLDPGSLVVTGHLAHDDLRRSYNNRRELRSRLSAQYGLDQSVPWVVLALPQLYEQGSHTWQDHLAQIRFICQALTHSPAEVLVSLHPKMNPEQYVFIGAEFKFALPRHRLKEILPAGDLFVATYSSTVYWAVLSGIPAVVLSFYGWNYKMFNHLPGVVVVKDKEDLVPCLERLLENPKYLSELADRQKKSASLLSPFDGKCAERVIHEILAHVAQSPTGI